MKMKRVGISFSVSFILTMISGPPMVRIIEIISDVTVNIGYCNAIFRVFFVRTPTTAAKGSCVL
jgi:hypothetical protein